jgi:hypothetical protein
VVAADLTANRTALRCAAPVAVTKECCERCQFLFHLQTLERTRWTHHILLIDCSDGLCHSRCSVSNRSLIGFQ